MPPLPKSKATLPVAGRRCNRSIDDMECQAYVFITNELQSVSHDTGLVALLSDYVRMGREYGDTMNTNAKNMRERIVTLEAENKKMRDYICFGCQMKDHETICESCNFAEKKAGE